MIKLHKFSTKTSIKIIVVIFVSICFTLLLFSSVTYLDNHEKNQKDTTALVNLIHVNIETFTIDARIVFKHLKHGKQIKINNKNYELDKNKTIDLKLPFNCNLNYLIFKIYHLNLKIVYNMLELESEDTKIINHINFINVTYDDDLDTYLLSCNIKTQITFVLIWIFSIVLASANFGFVSEIWIRNKGGSILQVIFLSLSLNTILNVDKFVSESKYMVPLTNTVMAWCLFLNGLSLIMLFAIFIFRYMNQKYFCGVRSNKVQEDKFRYENYAI